MGSLSNVLAGSGYRTRRDQIDQQEQRQEMAQMGVLQRLLAQRQAEQQAAATQDYRTKSLGLQERGVALQESAAARKAGAPQPIGAGGLLKNDGTVVPPAARPSNQADPEVLILTERLAKMQPNDPGRPYVVSRLKKLGFDDSKPDQSVPVTPVTIQDPNDPTGNSTIVIDGRTKAVIGKGPKLTQTGTAAQKLAAANRTKSMQISEAITNLEAITKNGGLLDKATGSGLGAVVDAAGRFVGHATEGGIAIGQLAPIFDLVLKMVPRFEGPQSDKDSQSYREAAGQLANPNIPAPQKKAAAKEILRLMKQRRGQFTTSDSPVDDAGGDASGVPDGIDPAVWAAMPPEDRALWQK